MNYYTKEIEELFSTNELSLLQNYENNLLKINLKMAEQENKKTEITCFIDTISKLDYTLISPESSMENYLKQIATISQLISKNIESLNSIKSNLIDINTFYQLLLKKENYPYEDMQLLKIKLDAYFSDFENIQKNISLTDVEIDNFVKKINALDNKVHTSNTYVPISKQDDISDNDTLIISEKENRVFLPYTVAEIKSYLEKYPKDYNSLESVINKEFIQPLDYYTNHPTLSRFREAYSLIRDREAKSVFDALKYGLDVMFKYDLNPAIISACKTEESLDFYLECLENNNLSKFDLFKIEFRLNPTKTSKLEIKV